MTQIAKLLIFAGLSMAAVGGLMLLLGPRLPLGRLPGDINVQRGNFSFSFPVVTCVLLSIVLTIVLNLFFRNR